MPESSSNPLENEFIATWSRAHPPLRPGPHELAFYERWMRRILPDRASRLLILGSTPELRDMALGLGLRATGCDLSAATWAAMRTLMSETGPEDFFSANWLEIPEDRNWDLIVGDGAIVMLPAAAIPTMFAKLRRLVSSTGAVVLRFGCRTQQRPLAFIRDAIADYHRDPGERTLYEHVMLLLNALRSEHHPDLPPREFLETRILPLVDDPADREHLRRSFFPWPVWLPERTTMDADITRHFRIVEAQENRGPGRWGQSFSYALQP